MKKLMVLLVALAVGWPAGGHAAIAPEGRGAPPIKTSRPRAGLELHVEATAASRANWTLSQEQSSGEVIHLPYDVSDRVPKYALGRTRTAALLAALDPTDETRQRAARPGRQGRRPGHAQPGEAAHAVAVENLHASTLEANAGIESAAAQLRLDDAPSSGTPPGRHRGDQREGQGHARQPPESPAH